MDAKFDEFEVEIERLTEPQQAYVADDVQCSGVFVAPMLFATTRGEGHLVALADYLPPLMRRHAF